MPLTEVAALAASMVKDRLEESGQIGRTENNSLSWDGNTEGKIIIMDAMVRVSATPFDLSQVESVTAYYPDQNLTSTIPISMFQLNKGEPLSMIMDADHAIVAVCTVEHYNEQYGANIPTGVYFCHEEKMRISAVKCADTIHPIDQKYLPNHPIIDMKLDSMSSAYSTEIPLTLAETIRSRAEQGLTAFCLRIYVGGFLTAAGISVGANFSNPDYMLYNCTALDVIFRIKVTPGETTATLTAEAVKA